MKSLINKIKLKNITILIRNSLRIKPVAMTTINITDPVSVSDAFCWRTDNGFKTTFKYSDLLNILYNKKNSFVELYFYSGSYF